MIACGQAVTIPFWMAQVQGAHPPSESGRVGAQARGVRFGRPAKLGEEQVVLTEKLLAGGRTAREVASVFGVHRATARRRDG